MANTVDKVIAIALAEVGYLEKASNANLYDKTANAGYNNYTKYGKEMHDIYPAVMDFPAAWCDAFVDWCFYIAYGIANAKALLGGNFDDYTVNSAQLYKNKKAWYTSNPEIGDQIFFKNSTRICHTGLVYAVDNKRVYTVEGNTSSSAGVVPNGGGVFKKSYLLGSACIAGYGRPKYDIIVEEEPVYEGFIRAADGVRWWYQFKDKSFAADGWYWLKETTGGTSGWYLFDNQGYMLTGYQMAPDGEYYFLCPKPGIYEGQCMVTDDKGMLKIAIWDSIGKRYIID